MLLQDMISIVARRDLSCTKTQGNSQRYAVRSAAPFCGGGRRPPPLCLATREILSCHNRDLVLPQHTSCLATTEILSCHNRHCVLLNFLLIFWIPLGPFGQSKANKQANLLVKLGAGSNLNSEPPYRFVNLHRYDGVLPQRM